MSDTETAQDVKGTDYTFTSTQDWFSFNVDTWRLLFPLVTSSNPRVLEIGSWEGRSAVFLLTELCRNRGEIVCIDHFDLMKTEAGRKRFAKIHHNLSLTKRSFRIIDEFSFPALMILLREEMSSTNPGYDWIYVDGSHEADDTFLDGELAWRLARKGAIIIFDDYRWDKEPENSIHHPKRGIDAFLALHAGEYNLLSSSTQYQVVLQKSSEMRIGFLVKEQLENGLDAALGYGIHIALTIDSTYAMAAAVAIRSAAAHTSGRITFYIIDLGLTDEDKDKINRSMPERADVTLVFMSPPEGSMAKDSDATWAKINMIPILPVERVLYLDADVLVRANLRELWDIDLKGKPIAGVTDVGYPLGHEDIQRGPYFNAGVLLMDLTEIRREFEQLKEPFGSFENTRYRDQDALNTHFASSWLPLELKWNAQGLGTYARLPSIDRDTLELSSMRDPAIVHFTGPVNPDMEHVLNPYLQPYTAKPWGYAGSPGHPFREEWWGLLEMTAWKGWRTSNEYREYCSKEKKKAIKIASDKFEVMLKERKSIR
ncbi:hypothetical protein AcW2_006871 [Taiwanofungus camphoratus]|nr:hypothetical protein AcW2_006871 [Antrodia cinnamomea]